MMSMPFMNSFWTTRSADHNRGQYAALYTIAWSVAQTTGPLIGGIVVDKVGWQALWWGSAGLCLVTSFGFWWFKRISL